MSGGGKRWDSQRNSLAWKNASPLALSLAIYAVAGSIIESISTNTAVLQNNRAVLYTTDFRHTQMQSRGGPSYSF